MEAILEDHSEFPYLLNIECVEAKTGRVCSYQEEKGGPHTTQRSFKGRSREKETDQMTEKDLDMVYQGRHEKDEHHGGESLRSSRIYG